jgi:hypothetical protein
MFTTSTDILNLVLTICLLLLTFFLCLALYNLIVSLRRINKVTKIIETGIVKVEDVVNLAKEKLRNSQTYFMILAEVAKRAIDFFQEKKANKKENKKKKK